MLKLSEKTQISHLELNVLRCLTAKSPGTQQASPTELSEIAFAAGIKDNDDVLRALYTLEGKSLVEPQPKGDFTSNLWQITNVGFKALEIIDSEV